MSGEKTFDPTPKRLIRAREDGQIANSHDVVAVVKLSMILGLLFSSELVWQRQLAELMSAPLDVLNVPFSQAATQLAIVAGRVAVAFSVSVLLVAILGTVGGTWLQTGFVMSFGKIEPKFDQLNPAEAVKKYFSIAQVITVLLNVAKIFVLAAVIVLTLREVASTMLSIGTGDGRLALSTAVALFRKLAVFAVLSFALLAALDYAVQLKRTTRALKMSLDEVRKDMKEAMGDPHVKSHRRRLAVELANEPRPATLVASASVVVTNPTHLAIAIYYRDQETPLPIVLAKGADSAAREMISAAQTAGVPVIRYIWLARTLFSSAQAGDFIPTAALQAVAAVLRAIEKVSRDAEGSEQQD